MSARRGRTVTVPVPAVVSPEDQERVLALVAEWLGSKGYGPWICSEGREIDNVARHADDGTDCYKGRCGPCPTGRDAAYAAAGPMLNPEWDWPSSGRPTPTVIVEGMGEWAYDCCATVQASLKAEGRPVFVEPYAAYALCIYPG